MNAKIRGYITGVVAAATYGMNPLFAVPLYGGGMDAESVLLWRYLLAIPIVAVMIRARGRKFGVRPIQLLALCGLGLMMGLSSLGLFMSYNYMDVGIASTLLFVYPLMVALIMSTFYRERLTLQTVICLLVALAGVWLLSASGGDGGFSWMGFTLVMLSSLAYAVYLVGINRPLVAGIPTLTLTFWVLVFGLAVFIVPVYGTGIAVPDNPWLWTNVVCLAVFPTVISFMCTNTAISLIGSTPTAILGVFEPVTAVLFGVAVFGETLSANEILGLVLILTAVSTVVAGDSITRQLLRVRHMFPRLRHKKRP